MIEEEWSRFVATKSDALSRGIGRAAGLGYVVATIVALAWNGPSLGWKWFLVIPAGFILVTIVFGLAVLPFRIFATLRVGDEHGVGFFYQLFGFYFIVCVVGSWFAAFWFFQYWAK